MLEPELKRAWRQLLFLGLWVLMEKQKKMICREEEGTHGEAEKRDHTPKYLQLPWWACFSSQAGCAGFQLFHL